MVEECVKSMETLEFGGKVRRSQGLTGPAAISRHDLDNSRPRGQAARDSTRLAVAEEDEDRCRIIDGYPAPRRRADRMNLSQCGN
jgi:hypothetical protein